MAVLDMIGTTVTVDGVVPDALRRSMRAVGVDPSDSELRSVRARSKREAIGDILARPGWDESSRAPAGSMAYDRFLQFLRRSLEEHLRPIDGAAEAIRHLSNGIGDLP